MKTLRHVLLLTLLLCLLAAPAIRADAIIEPEGDSFYSSHRDDVQYLFRAYIANGADGYVSLYKSPLSTRVRENVANGTVLSCSFLYTDAGGAAWGGVWGTGFSLRGWVRLDDCVVQPDYLSFDEAHQDDFVPYDSRFDDALRQGASLVLWTYPGSGVVAAENIDAQWFDGNMAEHFSQCYVDADGRFWAYVGYCYGVRNSWLCLSDPENADIPADPDVLPAGPALIPPADDIPAAGPNIPLLAVCITLGVVGGTAAVIYFCFRR